MEIAKTKNGFTSFLVFFSFFKSLPKVFGCVELHKKIQKLYFYLIQKFISIKRSILQYCVSNKTFYVKYGCDLTQYYKIDLLFEITFLSRTNSISFFLCNFMQPKTSDKLSVNIYDVYCTVKLYDKGRIIELWVFTLFALSI